MIIIITNTSPTEHRIKVMKTEKLNEEKKSYNERNIIVQSRKHKNARRKSKLQIPGNNGSR